MFLYLQRILQKIWRIYKISMDILLEEEDSELQKSNSNSKFANSSLSNNI